MAAQKGFYVNATGDQYFVAAYEDSTTVDKVAEGDWKELARGISTVDTDDSDETDDTAYYDGDGNTSTEVTGGTFGYSFEGDRYKGDDAQDMIAAMRFKKGSGRYVFLRHVQPDGSGDMGIATVQDIVVTGGDANEKGSFECAIHYFGTVTEIAATEAASTQSSKPVSK